MSAFWRSALLFVSLFMAGPALDRLAHSTLIDNVRLTRTFATDGFSRLRVWDADGRNLLADLANVYSGKAVVFSRPGPRSPLYAESYKPIGDFWVDDVRIDAIDPSTATIVRSIFPTVDGTSAVFPDAMISAPEPPTVRANVANRTVTIDWDAVEHAGDYHLEAGSRPGARDIVTFNTGGLTRISVSNVPPGKYYVRVRTIIELGMSAPSADLSIQVP